jgi:hypothetical protein
LVVSRTCAGHKQNGDACRAAPLAESAFCFLHDPDHADEAAQARKLGGLHRRRESTLAAVYDVGDLAKVEGIRRVLEIVVYDGLGMEQNSVNRGRMLIAASLALAGLLKTGELEAQLAELVAILKPRVDAQKERRR